MPTRREFLPSLAVGAAAFAAMPSSLSARSRSALPADIAIMFIGVNFVPDLQNLEAVPVRFYPNGTADEFTLLIRSDDNAVRKFTMDVATGVLKWELVREGGR